MEASDGGGREQRVESGRAYVRERFIECLKEKKLSRNLEGQCICRRRKRKKGGQFSLA